MSQQEHNKSGTVSHNNLPPKVGVNLLPLVHDFVQTFNEAVEVIHLLCHVLEVLQSLAVLPECGRNRDRRAPDEVCMCTSHPDTTEHR